jgi:predicted membrane channel-forming protein YqfA (hemolysin III family)
MTHAVQKWGRAQVDAQMGWNLLFLEGLLYITGAIIYAVTTICIVTCTTDG